MCFVVNTEHILLLNLKSLALILSLFGWNYHVLLPKFVIL